MARLYGSFLMRCWHLNNGAERIEIEHIQSGAKGLVASMAAATAWIEAHAGDARQAPDELEDEKEMALSQEGRRAGIRQGNP